MEIRLNNYLRRKFKFIDKLTKISAIFVNSTDIGYGRLGNCSISSS